MVATLFSDILVSTVDPGIKTPWLGIWWAWQTVTSVGYGDIVPVSWLGRFIGIVVMLMGVYIFCLLTANISAFLVKRERKKDTKNIEKVILQYLKKIDEKLDQLNKDSKKIKKVGWIKER